MILTKEIVLSKIREGSIKIQPFIKESVGPASIDLTLDDKIRIFTSKKEPCIIDEFVDYKKITEIIKIIKKSGYTLKTGELVLGITKEKITLPENICGWLNSRSRFARLGLMSHITAPFIAPGVSNKQVLEIYNASNRS